MQTENEKYLTVMQTYKQAQEISGELAPKYRNSVYLFIVSFLSQGFAFICFFPMLKNLFADIPNIYGAYLWLGLMALFAAIDLTARWFAHDFDYRGDIVGVTHGLRMRLGEKLRNMPLEKLYRFRTGDLNSIFSANVDEAVLHIGVVGSLFIHIVVVPAVVIAAAFVMDWRLGLAMAVIMPLGIPIYSWRRRQSKNEKDITARAHSDVESDIIEYTQGLTVLRAANGTGLNAVKLQRSIKTLRRVQAKGLTDSALPGLLMTTLVEAGLLTVLVLGVFFVSSGSLKPYILAALIIAVTRFAEPISLFINVTAVFDTVQSAFARIKGVLAVQELETVRSGAGQYGYDIEFKEVSFTYAEEAEKALDAVSVTIPYRSLTAVVGVSGSGKTTLIKMIMRYADPQTGIISIGGKDIRSFSQSELMSLISAVFQDVYLFGDTIMENIRMGRPEAADADVRAAAEAAYCHEFISRLPEGYHTRVGDIGGSLSGGERQRISIARAILKDAPIVILDEPTAALDTESEEAVQKAVDALVRNRTVIVIAHRLSTVRGADRIIVLEGGTVAEQGTHDELLRSGGRYHCMWEAQQRIKNWNPYSVESING